MATWKTACAVPGWTTWTKKDHRHFNRDGAGIDKGETFSGVDYTIGLQAMERMQQLFPGEKNLAPRALQWILRFPEVSCIIPGASKVEHLLSNISAPEMPPLTQQQQVDGMNAIYEEMVKADVHQIEHPTPRNTPSYCLVNVNS
ncbi:MAG: aryl-alcohol dehydrogenase-like predicted oxidoreductase [Neolewinella sp.]